MNRTMKEVIRDLQTAKERVQLMIKSLPKDEVFKWLELEMDIDYVIANAKKYGKKRRGNDHSRNR